MEFDFENNMSVENLDGIPEVYRGLYVESSEGGFNVSDAAKPLAEAYTGQTKALTEARGHNKTLNNENATRRTANKAVDVLVQELGLDGDNAVEVLKDHISELNGKIKNGSEIKVNLDKIKADHDRSLQEVVASKDMELKTKDEALNRYLIGQAATAALASAKGSVELLVPHIKERVKVFQEGDDYVVRVVDAAGDARSDGKGGWMGVADLVAEMKASATYARAFESDVASGSGITPTAPGRPVPKPSGERSSTDKISAGLKSKRAN